MTSLEEALACYPRHLSPLPPENIATTAALDRVLATDVHAAVDLPRFDQSAMDGYAFAAADSAAASPERPCRLPVVHHVAARAHDHLPALPVGGAARILTGAPLPPRADTVLPQELATLDDDVLVVSAPSAVDRNVRRRGEELRAGSRIALAHTRIRPGALASLVNADVEQVSVHRRPRIRLLVSGDEVRPAGTPLRHGQIHDSNGPLVCAVLQRWGYPAPAVQYVGDTTAAVHDALAPALDDADLVLTCGGASVGDHDYLPLVAEQLGVRRVFWKVAQKPGKPLYFGVRDGARGRSAVLAMPGNPGAVLISLCLHLRTILDCMESAALPGARWHRAHPVEPIERDPRRARLLRLRLDFDAGGCARVHSLPLQDSHMLSNLAAADVLCWVPPGDTPLQPAETLRWTYLP
jgi:molybdopterin molybdotransferase